MSLPVEVSCQDLVVKAIIGVYEWERNKRSTLRVDVNFTYDALAAVTADDLAQAIDYDKVSDFVQECLGKGAFKLLETAVYSCSKGLLERFLQMTSCTVTIHKPHVPVGAAESSVRLGFRRGVDGSLHTAA